jgi:GNAT superfamily N-acetyltransferase
MAGETTVTYLEMLERPVGAAPPAPGEGLTVVRAVQPTVSFYKFLYGCVGAPWHWVDRFKLADEQLASIVQHPEVEIDVLYVEGVPAGYIELDCRRMPDIEVAYFGIMPEFIGRRLGPFLLRFGLDSAWARGPRRVWLHTCNLDHPRALDTYLRAGFRIYDRRIEHP